MSPVSGGSTVAPIAEVEEERRKEARIPDRCQSCVVVRLAMCVRSVCAMLCACSIGCWPRTRDGFVTDSQSCRCPGGRRHCSCTN